MAARAVAASGIGFTRTESRLRVFTRASAMPLLLGLSTGVKQGSRWRASARSTVLAAAQIAPLSVSHWMRAGARGEPKQAEASLDAFDPHVADHLA
jgi:hypothetical protein